MDIFAAVMGLLCFFSGMTNGFAGVFGIKDSPKNNADRLSAFMIIAAMGFVMLAVMAP